MVQLDRCCLEVREHRGVLEARECQVVQLVRYCLEDLQLLGRREVLEVRGGLLSLAVPTLIHKHTQTHCVSLVLTGLPAAPFRPGAPCKDVVLARVGLLSRVDLTCDGSCGSGRGGGRVSGRGC